MSGELAVALHDVEPRSFARAKEIRGWLAQRGVERVTLLVIPASELHPIGPRAPGLITWLRGRVASGDAIAQHGLARRASGRPPWPRSMVARWQGGGAAEFPGLGADETARRVEAGRRLLNDVELDPRGFVAPAYAYTRPLRALLATTFDWFADVRCVSTRERGRLASPALCLGSSTPFKRALSPSLIRALARPGSPLLRIDVHPADFDLPRHVATLEALLELGTGRQVVTYDELGG